MKLSFATRLGLVIVIVLAACAYLGAAYVGAESECRAGQEQVDRTLVLLRKASDGKRTVADIQTETAKTQAQYRAIMDSYPVQVEDAAIVKKLLVEAEGYGLTVTTVTNSESVKKTEQYVYPSAAIAINVHGSYPAILAFVFKLEATRSGSELQELPKLTIDHIAIASVPDGYDAEIAFSVYARPEPAPKTATKGQSTRPAAS
jgi:Tfp pilus assembly protein PilO